MEVRPHGRHWRLLRCHQAPLPPFMLADGKIKKSDEAVDFIGNFHKEGRFTTPRIALSVGGPSIISKKIIVDRMSEMDLEDQITLEAEEYIPFDIDEVFLDFQILGDAEERMAVLLTACKKDFVNDKLELCRLAGLDPVFLDLDCLCIANAHAAFHEDPVGKRKERKPFFSLTRKPKAGAKSALKPGASTTGSRGGAEHSAADIVALANIGGQHLNTVILVDGKIDYTRDLSFGARSLMNELTEQTGWTMDELHQSLKNPDSAAPASALHEAWDNLILPFETKLAGQIRQSLDFFQASRPHKETAGILLLSGGATVIAGIEQRLSQTLGLPVAIFDPAGKLKKDRGPRGPRMEHPVGFAVALGLALRGLSP
ncbi:MAG: type IV pilus assembly protein PilM [Magnetococcales bacterium]|nr:type IV pilus assembly protein PilM [Magnetococcales bacterium]